MHRRDFLGAATGAALAAGLGAGLSAGSAGAQTLSFTPEPGAKLRILRWKRFVEGDETAFARNVQRFSEKYGVEVKVDAESWEDVRPKAAVAANVGSGPDLIAGWFDDPHQYPDKLVDMTDVAEYLGQKYGGWYDVCRKYGQRAGSPQWIAIPWGLVGNALVYRESHVRAAGFEGIPRDTAGFLELCKALKAKGTPPGFALGKAVGDGNNWVHWLLWSHGGRLVDEGGRVVINSPETIAALEYARALYPTFVQGTLSWQDPNNNKAFLDGQVSLTANGVSIYYSAKNSPDPKLQELAKDIQHARFPIGPSRKPSELMQITQWMLFKHCKYPNAGKELVRFLMEAEQYDPWMQASIGYVAQPLRAYESNPVWTADPRHAAYKDGGNFVRDVGHGGPLGPASASALADYIVLDMVAEAASGSRSPKEAAERAEKRAKRYYRG